ncbi:MAG TPA: tripartite tricarboxylate transporter substrate binding protein [Casimicrobiaceae bacterium]|nr:tripartite tricarboxylate transporter substrate binding protein [Casimicrobiaceae bacterium]
MRVGIALLAVIMFGGAAVPVALAQTPYPSKPVRIVVAYPPGGGIDVLARQLAERLSPQWNQSVVVENRPGATTNLAAELVAKSAADGHTILLTTDSTFSINPHLFAKLPFSERDFIPVTQLVLLQQVMLANPSLPANNLAELIALARAKPGTLNYGSYGSGSQPHLAAEMLNHKAGINLVHVPYKGLTFAIPAAIAGEVQVTFAGIASSRPPVQAGRLKALAIGGPKRSPLMPDVPTFAEQGFPEVETHAWFGLFVPAGTPRVAVERIHRDVSAILNDPDFREREIVQKGYDFVASSPEAFAAFIARDRDARGQAVKISGAKLE